jgi:hypothetical protein
MQKLKIKTQLMDLSTDQKKTKRKLVTGGQEPY